MRMKRPQKKKVTRDEVAAYLDSRQGLERDNLNLILKGARTSKRIGVVGGAIGVLGIIVATVVFLRASQPAPDWLWTVNTETGVPERVSMIVEQDSYGEVQDAYWATQFVRHYESYEWNTIQRDWDAVGLMASPDLAQDYREKIKTGPDALLNTLGQRFKIKVAIRSQVIDTDAQIATVRFTTVRHNVRDNYDEPPRHWIATFGYNYRAIPATIEERSINPFGYRVSGYRVHPEGN